jgi:hypothetical protein
MIICERPGLLWVTYGILSFWLFLGSVAFAEQVNLFAETSSQDEEALFCLASALLNDVLSQEDRFVGSVRATIAGPLSLLLGNPLFLSASVPILKSPALRSHQRVSVYRI